MFGINRVNLGLEVLSVVLLISIGNKATPQRKLLIPFYNIILILQSNVSAICPCSAVHIFEIVILIFL